MLLFKVTPNLIAVGKTLPYKNMKGYAAKLKKAIMCVISLCTSSVAFAFCLPFFCPN